MTITKRLKESASLRALDTEERWLSQGVRLAEAGQDQAHHLGVDGRRGLAGQRRQIAAVAHPHRRFHMVFGQRHPVVGALPAEDASAFAAVMAP